MSEIPDDIMQAARKVVDPLLTATGPLYAPEVERNIARAILAERERCAKIADGESGESEDDYGEAYDRGYRESACYIATAIRSGEKPCCEGGPQWGHAWGCPKCPD